VLARLNRAVVQRVCLGAVAVLILVWLGVALRDARRRDEGKDAVRAVVEHRARGQAGRADRERLAEAGRQLDRARLLNPDRSILIDRGIQLLVQGRRREARARFQEATRHEPENADAWIWVATANRTSDPARAALARARVRRLDPIGADQLVR
jgi:tetratricopeptide (TPR) repeat protein